MAIINKASLSSTDPAFANPLQVNNPLNFGVKTFDAEAEGDAEQAEQAEQAEAKTETPADEA